MICECGHRQEIHGPLCRGAVIQSVGIDIQEAACPCDEFVAADRQPGEPKVYTNAEAEALVALALAAYRESDTAEFERGREEGFEFCCGLLCPMCAEGDPTQVTDLGRQHSDMSVCHARALRGDGNDCGDADEGDDA